MLHLLYLVGRVGWPKSVIEPVALLTASEVIGSITADRGKYNPTQASVSMNESFALP